MRIIDLLKKSAVELNLSALTKDEAIDRLISLHEKSDNLSDEAAFRKAILAREAQGATAIGRGIAVPHAKSDSVRTPGLAVLTVPDGVDYSLQDGKKYDIVFMIAAPPDSNLYLEILSRLMAMLMDSEFSSSLRNAKTADAFLSIIDKKESEKYPEPSERIIAI